MREIIKTFCESLGARFLCTQLHKDWIPKKTDKSKSMIFNGETLRNDFIFLPAYSLVI